MTPWDKLEWLRQNAHIVHVEANDHRAYYETVAQTLQTRDDGLFDEDEADIRDECIRRNELVIVHVYPSTPIGFFRIGHHDMAAAIDIAYEVVRKDLRAAPNEDETQAP